MGWGRAEPRQSRGCIAGEFGPPPANRRAADELERKRHAAAFDVFLCHNSADKSAVKRIGQKLMDVGILPWLDE